MTSPAALPTFDLALRGYDRRQVDEYLDRLEHDLAVAQADRDAAATRIALTEKRLDELETELQAARDQLEETARPTYAGLGKRVEQLLTLAEEEARELRADAVRDAAEVRAVAGTLVEETKKKSDQAQREFEASLEARRKVAEEQEAAARADAEKRLKAAEQRITDAGAAADKRTAESDAAALKRLAAAHAEADRLVRDSTARSERLRKDAEQHANALVQAARHDVDRIALEAQSQADTIVAEARAKAQHGRSEHNREVEELIRRRDAIRDQLNALRQVIGALPEAITEDEDRHSTAVTPPEDAPDRSPGDPATEAIATHAAANQSKGADQMHTSGDLRKTGT